MVLVGVPVCVEVGAGSVVRRVNVDQRVLWKLFEFLAHILERVDPCELDLLAIQRNSPDLANQVFAVEPAVDQVVPRLFFAANNPPPRRMPERFVRFRNKVENPRLNMLERPSV